MRGRMVSVGGGGEGKRKFGINVLKRPSFSIINKNNQTFEILY